MRFIARFNITELKNQSSSTELDFNDNLGRVKTSLVPQGRYVYRNALLLAPLAPKNQAPHQLPP